MLRKLIFALSLILATEAAFSVVTVSDKDRERARDLVSRMTLDEKISYLSGETSFSLRPIERLGIPRVLLADGPQGIRNHCKHSTLYPCGVLAAATWNRGLINRYGQSLGDDARARGVGILLGPGVNIYRSPLCGRNFEYMGEDPYLTSEIACEYIKGLQSRGVMATIKHFAANNQEWSRHHVSSDVDERTLQEIYFPAFRKAVQKAGVGAVMNSYNLLNGVHATENQWLNTMILRDSWGFDGILMSDWTSVYSTVNAVNSGLDLEMPKAVQYTDSLLREALTSGKITMGAIDTKVAHQLQTLSAFGLLDRDVKDTDIPLDCKSSRETALQTAREGIVLLKNEGGILPLKGRTVVLGANADTIVSGGGSGAVSAFSVTPLSKALTEMSRKATFLSEDDIYRDITQLLYADTAMSVRGLNGKYFKNIDFSGNPDIVRTDSGVNFDYGYSGPADGFPTDGFSISWDAFYRPESDELLKIGVGGDDGYRFYVNDSIVAGHWGNHSFSERVVSYPVHAGETYRFRLDYFDSSGGAKVNLSLKSLDSKKLEKALKGADNVVLCTGFNGDTEGEGFDRSFGLPDYEEEFIRGIARINPNLTVVLNSGGAVDLSAWFDSAKAILMAWYPGQEGGTALAEILTGKISPSGKLPVTYDRSLDESPVSQNYYANRRKVRSSDTRECRHVQYNEGVFLGYRGYDRAGVAPLYPFGYGLSYSTFEFSDLNLKKLGENEVEVSFTLTNTGKREAAEVAQVYVSDTECSVPRPLKELKGFEKVLLKPGESRQLKIVLDSEAFSFYDMDRHKFIVEPGEFIISVGNSSADLPLAEKIIL
ncbi:MAG: beta-glucosidase [Bacteroidales bacterium]|nr:beta-glucosidase [Bacteroidales bacterium]